MITNQRSPHEFWLIIVIIIVIIFGVFFRVTNIDKKIYWHDEVYTSLRVAGYNDDQVIETFFNGNIITAKELLKFQNLSPNTPLSNTIKSLNKHPEHPPFYYILLRFWQDIFGSSIIINRSLSIIFSLLIFLLIYWVSWELFNDKLIALITVGLIAISPFQILYAQEAREYSLWMLTITLSSLFFMKSINTNKVINWISYSLILSATFYTSILSAFLPIVNIAYIYLIRKSLVTKIKINFALYTLISVILFIPWIIVAIINIDILKNKTNWTNIEKPLEFLANLWGLHFTSLFADLGFPLYHWASYIFIILIFSLIGYTFFFVIKNTDKNIWLYLLLSTLIPSLGLILPDIIFGGVKSSMTRYFIPAFLPIYLSIGYTLGKKNQQKSQIWSIILLIVFTFSIVSNFISSNAETWWNKSASYHNPAIAKIINQGENPLLITQDFEINRGNIISLSHNLKSDINLQLLAKDTLIIPSQNFTEIYIFNPSPELIKEIENLYQKKVVKVYDLLYQSTFQ
jgi:uncharacterized membrane protein